MSLRPEISGFSLEKLRSLRGKGDSQLIVKAMKSFQRAVELEDPSDVAAVRRIVEQIVMEGEQYSTLEAENEIHVFAALALAKCGQRHSAIGSGIWKVGAFDNLIKVLEGRLSPEVLGLLGYLSNGRALWGKKIQSTWSYYAFLESSEVNRLLKELQAIQKKTADPTKDNFLEELVEWLEMISSEKKDLWMFAS